MKQLEDTGILKKVDQLFKPSQKQNSFQNKEIGDFMGQMKICIKASEKISGIIDKLQRFVANTVYPLFPELESLVYSKEQFIRCLNRMVNCVNPETINIGKSKNKNNQKRILWTVI